MQDTTRKLRRWNQIVSGQETVEIGRTPRQAVYQRDLLTLYRYDRDTPAPNGPILLVYSLVNKPAVLDLLPGRSVVERLLEGGFDVFLLDWGEPSALDYYAGMDTYVNLYLKTVVRQVCKLAKTPQIQMLGYCMGGTLAACYTALHPKRIKSLTLLATPLRFRSDQQLYKWATDPSVNRPEKLVEAWRTAPPWSFDGYSLLTLDKKPAILKNLYDNLDNEVFLESYLAMDAWVSDNIPMAASIYSEFIRGCFLEDRLLEDQLKVGKHTVKLREIDCPVLIISGHSDHLVPTETTACDENLFSNQEHIGFPSGHVGLSMSRKSHTKLWPQVCEWLATH